MTSQCTLLLQQQQRQQQQQQHALPLSRPFQPRRPLPLPPAPAPTAGPADWTTGPFQLADPRAIRIERFDANILTQAQTIADCAARCVNNGRCAAWCAHLFDCLRPARLRPAHLPACDPACDYLPACLGHAHARTIALQALPAAVSAAELMLTERLRCRG